jgi:cytochrome oxidase Cu insertion factor (SCO1/SenC/PrrC family)
MTVHALPTASLDEQARRTRAGRWKLLGVVLFAALPVIASYFTFYVVRPEGRTNYGELISPPRPMPALTLRDLDGARVDAASLHGQWLLVVVGPAACPPDCEQRLFMQRQLRTMTGRERDRIDRVWLVTDDAPVAAPLRAALAAVPAAQVLRVPAHELAGWLAPAPGQPLEAHLYIVDPRGDWMMRVPVEPEPRRVMRDLMRLLRASSSWDHAGR